MERNEAVEILKNAVKSLLDTDHASSCDPEYITMLQEAVKVIEDEEIAKSR